MRTPISIPWLGLKVESALLGVFALTGVLRAQSTPVEPDRFEVASIRRSIADSNRPSMQFTPDGGVRVTHATLKMLIQVAYDVRSEQVVGGPGWTDSEEYTVIAKGTEGGPVRSESQADGEFTRRRLQVLLSERFHLALKLEAKPAAGYILVVDQKGHKMTLAESPDPRRLRQTGRWVLSAERVEISILAQFLGVHLRSTVEDRTGLEGRYNFQLDWNPAVWTAGVVVPDPMSAAANAVALDFLCTQAAHFGSRIILTSDERG